MTNSKNKKRATISVLERLCIESNPENCGVVIFGASGDLANRKILPSFYNMYTRKLLPKGFFLLGCGRTAMTDDVFRERVRNSLQKSGTDISSEFVKEFLSFCFYCEGDYYSKDFYENIKNKLFVLDKKFNSDNNHIFYFALPADVYLKSIKLLSEAKLIEEKNGWKKIVIEKPHGHNLDSANHLLEKLNSVLNEKQIYLIDHYLGKDTVQNILIFRFANIVFEPVWNRNYIDHIEIIAAESIGVGDRAGYFDKSGVLRDMFQNHMMQLLSLVAMEQPLSFDAENMRDEKTKLLKAIQPFPINELEKYVVRGQYSSGEINGKKLNGYLEENNIPEDSKTETFVAAKILIDNERWQGVPFYLMSGKRLHCKKTQIAVYFKNVAHSIFPPLKPKDLGGNILVFNVQPNEGISLTIESKHPGPKLCMGDLNMQFLYKDVFSDDPPDAYERLLLDCMLGDQTLFIRENNVKLTWKIFTPVLDEWENNPDIPLYKYPAGSRGPVEADEIPRSDKRIWQSMDCWWERENPE